MRSGAKRKFTTLMLVLTLILGGIFVGVKGYEYSVHIHHGLFPGAQTYTNIESTPQLTQQVQLFMTFYFTMTGLHALHMVIGLGVLAVQLYFALRYPRFGMDDYTPIEVSGLYWHFVDVVWIVIFTVVYLIR